MGGERQIVVDRGRIAIDRIAGALKGG